MRARSALHVTRVAAFATLLAVSCSPAGGPGRVLAAPPADGGIAHEWSRAPIEKTQIRRGYVSRVLAGDIIEVRVASQTRNVRLIGIKAPDECFRTEAAEQTSFRLEGGRVRLELDVDKEDDDGRLLAYVWHRGSLFNRALVSRGYATVSSPGLNLRYSDLLAQAQGTAKTSRRGMWDACFPEPKPKPNDKGKQHKR
ncbi:MAG: thermonuclease family protein [Actinomycetota bacterium]|nr:thermonuclease family protein [Actinomycetota bacterium]